MTNSGKPANLVLSDTALMDDHDQRIKPLWDAAFKGPVWRGYKPNDIVWLYDHYNTARVIGMVAIGNSPLKWRVETSHADGTVHQYEYQAEWLRPATEECVFHWPANEASKEHPPWCECHPCGAKS